MRVKISKLIQHCGQRIMVRICSDLEHCLVVIATQQLKDTIVSIGKEVWQDCGPRAPIHMAVFILNSFITQTLTEYIRNGQQSSKPSAALRTKLYGMSRFPYIPHHMLAIVQSGL